MIAQGAPPGGGMPPLPPQAGGSYPGLTPQGAPPMGGVPGAVDQSTQVGGAAMRMGMEIDKALKLLAQAVPQLAPWVNKTTIELRQQLAQVLSAGIVPALAPGDNSKMPDGGGNL